MLDEKCLSADATFHPAGTVLARIGAVDKCCRVTSGSLESAYGKTQRLCDINAVSGEQKLASEGFQHGLG